MQPRYEYPGHAGNGAGLEWFLTLSRTCISGLVFTIRKTGRSFYRWSPPTPHPNPLIQCQHICVHCLFQALSSYTVALTIINAMNGTSFLYLFFDMVKGDFLTGEIALICSLRRNLDVATNEKECIPLNAFPWSSYLSLFSCDSIEQWQETVTDFVSLLPKIQPKLSSLPVPDLLLITVVTASSAHTGRWKCVREYWSDSLAVLRTLK